MRIALVLLAAGASRRFGRPKALLTLGGRTFLERILDTARAAGLSPLLVTVAADDEALHAVLPGDAPAVINDDLEAGPMGGIRRAVERLLERDDVGGFLLWPVDAPRVRDATVRELALAGPRGDVAIPTHEGRRGHPAYFGRPTFARFLDRRYATPREVQAASGPRLIELPVDDPSVLDDIDTPEDHARLLAEEGEG